MTLNTTIRQELALNAEEHKESLLRCTCDDCMDALKDAGVRIVNPARIREVFKALDEAAYRLPIPKEWLDHPAVEAFNLAKHHVHVLLHEIASGEPPTPETPTDG